MHKTTKLIKLGLAFVGMALGLLGFVNANAKAIQYKTLRYGTNQTSIASGYFKHPASVTVKNGRYVVTVDIKTAKKLSSYPVKVLNVNGGAPKNVRKVKDAKGNSNLYFSFYTKNLNKKINAKLAINVPGVYKAKHMITFKFNTAGLPALHKTTRAKVSPASKPKQTRVTSVTPKHHAQKKSDSAKQSSQAKPKTTAKKAVAQPNKTKQPAKTSKELNSPKQSDPKKDSKKQPAKTKKQNKKTAKSKQPTSKKPAKQVNNKKQNKQKNSTPIVVSSVAAVVVVAGGAGYYFFKKRK